MLVVEIVDQDQVEIGGRGHLAPAELAHGQHRGRLAAHMAVRGGEIIGDRAMHGADHRVGQPREGLARLPRRHRAGQNAHADQEHVFEPEHADAFEQVLVVARLRKRGVEPPAEFGVVRQRAEEARIDQRIHHLRIARQRVGEPRRDAEHKSDQGDEIGILPQQRQQPRRPVQIGEETIEQHQRRVGIVGARQLLEQDRQQRFEMAARHLAAQRTMPAGKPVAHDRRGFQRRAEAELGQAFQRLAVVGVGRKRQAPAGRRRAPFRTDANNAAARCRDDRAAPWRKRRGLCNPESARSARVRRARPAATCVCSSLTICSRCSTVRRKT